jgi:glutathione S-transferase
MLRCLRIPYSTNVERVALAAGHKGLELDWIDVSATDRSEVERISGQPLVPVLLDGDTVVTDSTAIIRHLEKLQPDPPLWPAAPAARAELDVFLEWFDLVWKGPPNAIADELESDAPDQAVIADAAGRLRAWLHRFEGLLSGRDFLLGPLTAADCIAFPFLKYGVIPAPADDDEVFHQVLTRQLAVGDDHANLTAWVRRVDALPRS